ncbi:hypothetical protein [Streptomyces sp. NBC_01443]|uniref:hypothetical protein n=1 Tax=Streptomyces sp. NBC_01443 TaxID=2903868 RepID=UPI002250789F|nr:hypothetical protein [Streptomyces sp. NBC_01443]MCX4626598.1 hypothetical protein [Streptomyces sp. NBC_01443]
MKTLISYLGLVGRHWISITIAGVVAAALGVLDLTALDISISWALLTLLLTMGLAVAQYRVWLDMKNKIDSIGPGALRLERVYDLGVNIGELKAIETLLTGLESWNSDEMNIEAPLLRKLELKARLRAIMAELEWPFSENTEHISLEIQGMVSGLSAKRRSAFELGREVATNVDMLLWLLKQHATATGTQLSVNPSLVLAAQETILSSVHRAEQLEAKLGMSDSSRLRSFVTDWTSYHGSRSMDRWFGESEDIKAVIRADISRSVTGVGA